MIGVVSLVFLALVTSGCQKSEGGGALKDRAAKYWELRQSKAWEQIYDGYLDPAAKSRLTKEAFLKRRLLAYDILSYEISEIKEANDAATVAVSNEANIPLREPAGAIRLIKKRVMTEDAWVRRDGVWYVELEK